MTNNIPCEFGVRAEGLVSIIMPLLNSEKYLGEAIESVLRQTYTDWELLIIDDGSTDNSLSIAYEYAQKDYRISVYVNPNHTGLPSSPRNYGIQISKGGYIAFLDSDDVWLKDKLSQQIPLLKDNRTAVVYSDYEKIDEEGKRSARIVSAPIQTDYKNLLYGNIIGNLTGIYDVTKIGKQYFPSIHHEDYAFWLSALKSGYIARSTGTITALYRIHSESVSSNKLRNISWQWNIYRNIENISLVRSLWYFISYALKGVVKSFI